MSKNKKFKIKQRSFTEKWYIIDIQSIQGGFARDYLFKWLACENWDQVIQREGSKIANVNVYYSSKQEAQRYLDAYCRLDEFHIGKTAVGWYICFVPSDGELYLYKNLKICNSTGWEPYHRYGEAPGYYSSKEGAERILIKYLLGEWSMAQTEEQLKSKLEQNKRDIEKLQDEGERLQEELKKVRTTIEVGDCVEVRDNSAVIGIYNGEYHTLPTFVSGNRFVVVKLGLTIAENYNNTHWSWGKPRISDALITDGFGNYWFVNSNQLQRV